MDSLDTIAPCLQRELFVEFATWAGSPDAIVSRMSKPEVGTSGVQARMTVF